MPQWVRVYVTEYKCESMRWIAGTDPAVRDLLLGEWTKVMGLGKKKKKHLPKYQKPTLCEPDWFYALHIFSVPVFFIVMVCVWLTFENSML